MAEVTSEDLDQQFDLMHSDPQRYLSLVNEYIRQNPSDAVGYGRRHQVWAKLGRHDLAMNDLDIGIALDPRNPALRFCRGWLLREIGRYEEAIEEINQAFELDPDRRLMGFGELVRADCHARLGNEAAAVADCALLGGDHWMHGFSDLPGGTRDEATAEVKRRAAVARARRNGI